ncbi:MAG: tetratricopeptide repeat protein [Spirochaetota bacterium]
MTRARRVAGVCLFLCCSALLVAQTDSDISLLYVEAAEEALSGGDVGRAEQLMEIAREFAPRSSDVLYLSASIDSMDRDTTMRAIDRARSAVDNASWQRYTAMRGAVLLASLLNRTDRQPEAIAVLEATEEAPDTADGVLAEYYYELLRALHVTGRQADVDSLLALARDRFPDDPRYFKFVLEGERSVSREHRLELERLMEAADSDRWESPLNALLFEYAVRAPTEGERRWAVSTLEAREWRDARLARAILPDEPDRAVSWFLDNGGPAELGVYFELLGALDSENAERLRASASEFSGWSQRDTEGDGLWNERVRVEGGTVVLWQRDMDQDGTVELEVEFGPSEPTGVVIRDEVTAVRLGYSRYPFLEQGEIATELGREVFVLRPRSIRLDVMQPLAAEGPGFDGESRVAGSVRRVGRQELIAAAIQTDHVRADGTIAERIFNEAGTRSRILRDESGNGVWDHLMLNDGGFVTSGLRDIDGDGYYEVAEAYRNGRLVAVAIDSDDNGIPEVFEQYDTHGAREWDLNEDGRIDVREFSFWTDSILREFPLSEQGR